MKTKTNKVEKKEKEKIANAAECIDLTCPIHGKLSVRGRAFQGVVIRKLPRRVAIEFERTLFVKKFERYSKKKTRIHARLPACMEQEIKVGDYIRVQECRPLSKIIHFVVIKKLREAGK